MNKSILTNVVSTIVLAAFKGHCTRSLTPFFLPSFF